MSLAISGSWEQFAALRGARRAVDRTQRGDSPRIWMFKRMALLMVAVTAVAGNFWISGSIVRTPGLSPENVFAFFLLGTVTGAGYVLLIQLREGGDGHPLGGVRHLLPMSRTRSAVLAVVEGVWSPTTLFVLAYGLTPWLAMAQAGERWLGPAGWLTVALLLVAGLMWKEWVAAFQSWLIESTRGDGIAFTRLALIFAVVLFPLVPSLALGAVGRDASDVFDLPFRAWTNHPLAPPAASGAALGFLGLAVWTRTWRGMRFGRRFTFGRSLALDAPIVFREETATPAAMRMMYQQANRTPSSRYAVAVLGLFGIMLIWLPGPTGIFLVTMAAAITPLGPLFNLYGADSAGFVLWLGSGQPLSRWTAARQRFHGAQFLGYSMVGLTMLALAGAIPGTTVPGVVALPFATLGIAVVAGPRVSHYVLAPSNREVGRRLKSSPNARSFIPTLIASGLVVVVCLIGIPIARSPWWGANWAAAAVLCGLAAALRSHRARWTPRFRARMAASFRD